MSVIYIARVLAWRRMKKFLEQGVLKAPWRNTMTYKEAMKAAWAGERVRWTHMNKRWHVEKRDGLIVQVSTTGAVLPYMPRSAHVMGEWTVVTEGLHVLEER